jgi:hypothetical protein
VVVATGGNLYACAPMVGEDRDDGPEAALRLGHLDDGDVVAAVAAKGTSCGAGKGCACAAYLETGNPATPGDNQRWFSRLCRELGAALAAGLAEGRRVEAPIEPPRRRPLVGLALGVGGLAAAAGLVQISQRPPRVTICPPGTPPETQPAPPPPVPPDDIHVIAGGMRPIEPPEPPPPPEPRTMIDGDLGE